MILEADFYSIVIAGNGAKTKPSTAVRFKKQDTEKGLNSQGIC
jgi:hypothetical protein